MRFSRVFPVFCCALVFSHGGVRALPQSEIDAINGFKSQQFLGTGKGATVAVLAGGIDDSHPAIRGSVVAQRDFTGERTLDDDSGGSGFGTGIAGLIAGHDYDYTGVAPGAKLINARVDGRADLTSDTTVGNGMIWSGQAGARVITIGIGNRIGRGPLTSKTLLISDYVAERYGVSVVSAVGNENDSAATEVPAGSFNGIAVGALERTFQRTTEFSNYSLDADARTKPDLVAPGIEIQIATADWEKNTNYWTATGTAYAAPMVSGVLAQLIGYGKNHRLPVDPLLLKAVLLSSATKVRDADGARWDPRRGGRDPDQGYVFGQPLDDEQGAGRVDAMAAYRLYAGKNSHSSPVNTWHEGKLRGNQSFVLPLGRLTAGETVDASLTWFRHVGRKDRGGGHIDADDKYYQSASLADFTLALLRNGRPIAASDTDDDTLEHLSWTLESKGKYALEVYRFRGSGLEEEDFAVAARVLQATATSIQRSRPNAVVAADSMAYGFSAAPVPEPTGAALLLICASCLLRRR